MNPLISIVIPVYKAQECLEELYNQLVTSTELITENYEIIFIDDRSPDDSWEMLLSLAQKNNRVRSIRLSRNFGQHNAITAGIKFASGEWLVVMDCDLQDPPKYIIPLFEKALSGFDVVIARRKNRKDGIQKRFTSNLFYKLFSLLSGMSLSSDIGNFRIISRKVYIAFNNMNEDLRFFGGMIQWLGFNTGYIDIEHASRFAGASSYNYKRLLKLSLMFILAYSERPLYTSILLGILSFILSLTAAGLAFYNYLRGVPPTGWTSLIISIYMMGGLILFMLGVLGIYIGKIFNQVKFRPNFVIDQKINL